MGHDLRFAKALSRTGLKGHAVYFWIHFHFLSTSAWFLPWSAEPLLGTYHGPAVRIPRSIWIVFAKGTHALPPFLSNKSRCYAPSPLRKEPVMVLTIASASHSALFPRILHRLQTDAL